MRIKRILRGSQNAPYGVLGRGEDRRYLSEGQALNVAQRLAESLSEVGTFTVTEHDDPIWKVSRDEDGGVNTRAA